MPKHGSIILYVHGNQKARWDGQLRTATSTLTQLLNYGEFSRHASYLFMFSWVTYEMLVWCSPGPPSPPTPTTRNVKDINLCRIRCQVSVQLCVSVLLQFEELCKTSSSRSGLPLYVCLIFAVYFEEQASFCRPAEMSDESSVCVVSV